ncbi:MAG TPA: hypothetical protein VGK77_29265, partial [Candidatus Binatia bacterium]
AQSRCRCFTESTLSFAEGFSMTQQQMPSAFLPLCILAREIQRWLRRSRAVTFVVQRLFDFGCGPAA